jgi:ABC-type phosphate/phosphonate transport system substrate-binding protein
MKIIAKKQSSINGKLTSTDWNKIWNQSTLKPIITAAFLGIILISCRQNNTVNNSETPSSPPLSVKTSLTLGVVTTPYNSQENYTALEQHLEEKLSAKMGSPIEIAIEPIENKGEDPLKQARNRLAEKKWDIAFTTSSILSIAARNNNYVFAARMFPQAPKFESSLFVLNESPIQGINDLTPDKTIALGELSNPAMFYIPFYDLYGKILKVDRGNPNYETIIEKVKSAQADVGAAPFQIVNRDPQLRVIQRSRSIPLSGVYLSPTLPESQQNDIQEALLNASEQIQKKAQYAAGEEPDYQYLSGITNRVDTILSCVDLNQQPVQFFCPQSQGSPQTSGGNANGSAASGQVNGYQINGENITITLNGEGNRTYRILVSRPLLDRVPNAIPLAELQDKTIQISDVESTQNGATIDFKIDRPEQLNIVP